MTRTRNGKIARLPFVIREELNRRLRDGEPAQKLVVWLNALPEVQELIATEFDGHPLRDQNVSQWKQGGFREWAHRQEALQIVRELGRELPEPADDHSLTETLGLALAAQFVLRAEARVGQADPEKDLAVLRRMCADYVALARCNHRAARLRLDRSRLERRSKPQPLSSKRTASGRNHERSEIDEKSEPTTSPSSLSSISPFSWFKSSLPPGSLICPLASRFSPNPTQSHLDFSADDSWPPATTGLPSVIEGFGPDPLAVLQFMSGISLH